jgi:hypothetical protein
VSSVRTVLLSSLFEWANYMQGPSDQELEARLGSLKPRVREAMSPTVKRKQATRP